MINSYLTNFFHLIRVRHWLKNLFVFLPIFFAGQIQTGIQQEFICLFFSFCFAASIIYVFNDLMDVAHDRAHPKKRKRPIASGFFSQTAAYGFIIFLSILLIISLLLGESAAYAYVLAYIFLNVLYSWQLKKIAIIDVSCISLGFVLRIVAGSVVGQVRLSHWMVIIVFLLTLSIAFAKRREDFSVNIEESLTRKSKTGYSIPFLDVAKSISFSITLVAYILYALSPEVMAQFGTDKIYISALFVFWGIMRYLQISIVFKDINSPIYLLYKDRFLQMTILLWMLTFVIIVYG